MQEGGDASLGVRGQGVHGHDLLGIGVGFGLIEINLRVVGLLADRQSDRAGLSNASFRVSSRKDAAGTTLFMSSHSAAAAAGIMSPVSSISRVRFVPTRATLIVCGVGNIGCEMGIGDGELCRHGMCSISSTPPEY